MDYSNDVQLTSRFSPACLQSNPHCHQHEAWIQLHHCTGAKLCLAALYLQNKVPMTEHNAKHPLSFYFSSFIFHLPEIPSPLSQRPPISLKRYCSFMPQVFCMPLPVTGICHSPAQLVNNHSSRFTCSLSFCLAFQKFIKVVLTRPDFLHSTYITLICLQVFLCHVLLRSVLYSYLLLQHSSLDLMNKLMNDIWDNHK